MAIRVKSIDELKQVMLEETQKAMIKAEDGMLDIIHKRINKEVYQAYQPQSDGYQRTYSLLSSLNTGTYEVNNNRIRSYINHDPSYATWKSVKDGEKFDDVDEVVSFGTYGTFNGVGYDGQIHHLNPSGTQWGKPRFYMFIGTQEYIDELSWRLPYSCRVNYW